MFAIIIFFLSFSPLSPAQLSNTCNIYFLSKEDGVKGLPDGYKLKVTRCNVSGVIEDYEPELVQDSGTKTLYITQQNAEQRTTYYCDRWGMDVNEPVLHCTQTVCDCGQQKLDFTQLVSADQAKVQFTKHTISQLKNCEDIDASFITGAGLTFIQPRDFSKGLDIACQKSF